jgi:hypothetical protein
MHPMILTELAAARHADLLHDAEMRRRTRAPRTARHSGRPSILGVAALATVRQLRASGLKLSDRSVRRSRVEACCA